MPKFNVRALAEVNKELWLLLSLFAIAGALNYLLAGQHALLDLYFLPAVFSAYVYGRRHAVLTAVASVFIVLLLVWFKPHLIEAAPATPLAIWCEFIIWGGVLVLVADAMGLLYDRGRQHLEELRETYHGVLMILQQFIAKDKYTQNHSYRVSLYARAIAARMGFNGDRLEDIRAAALLHDIGKLDIGRDLLYKAARLTEEEFKEMQRHVDRGVEFLAPVGGSLRRVLPIILAHHDKFDGTGYRPVAGQDIPVEARILSVADVYDSLTSDRPYRQAMSPFEAKTLIQKGAGSDFDPQVVDAFLEAFRFGALEVPELVV